MKLNPVLPGLIDNVHRGHPLAIWLLVPILIFKSGIALGTIFNGRAAAQTADGIPLDSFGAAGAAAVVTLFALWGLSQLVFGTLGVLALVRYRAMIPLVYVLLLVEHVARRGILLAMPIARGQAPPGLYINLALLVSMTVGLAFALRPSARLGMRV